MSNKRKKTIKQILFSSASLTLIGFVILVLISIPLVRTIKKRVVVNDEISLLDQEIANLEKKNTELNDLISYLNSDQFADEQARLNLNYKKEGEEVVIIKDDTTTGSKAKEKTDNLSSIYNIEGLEKEKQDEKNENYKKWILYFLQKDERKQ